MDFERIKAAVKEAADDAGITEYEIYYEQSESAETSAFRSEINSFSSSVSGGICLRCKVGDKMGYASTECIDASEMSGLVARAAENAKLIEKDEKSFIYAGGAEYKALDTKKTEMPDAGELASSVLECQASAYEADKRVSDGTSSGAFVGGSTIRIFNSAGLDLSGTTGYQGLYIEVIANDGEETNTSFKAKIAPLSTIDKKALAEKTVAQTAARFGASKVKTGKYDIVFDTSKVRDFIGTFSDVFNAKAVQMGMSLLKGKLGEKIASDKVTIVDDPFNEQCPVKTAFDAEGVPTYKKNVVENGVLKTFLYNLSTADTDGVQSTGNASKGSYAANIGTSPYCMSILPGDKTREELFELTGDGIYVTEMKGFHAGANAVTGDFSIESAGFLIKDGKLGAPVKEFTVAGNFFELIKNIEQLSDTVEYSIPGGFTQFGAPDILVRNMSVGGE